MTNQSQPKSDIGPGEGRKLSTETRSRIGIWILFGIPAIIFLILGILIAIALPKISIPFFLKGNIWWVIWIILGIGIIIALSYFIYQKFKKYRTSIIITGIILLILMVPWRNIFPSAGLQYYQNQPDSLKIPINEWVTIKMGEKKYMYLRYRSPFLIRSKPLYDFEFEGLNEGDTVYADYIRISTDRLFNRINWAAGMPIHINGYPYGTKEKIPKDREPDVIPLTAYGCYRVTYSGPSKKIRIFIKKI